MKNRLLHIYCGDGKGKTTAATGLAVRAAGSSMRVLFARFLKNEFSGELKILDQIPEIEVLHLEKAMDFLRHFLKRNRKKSERCMAGCGIRSREKSAQGIMICL